MPLSIPLRHPSPPALLPRSPDRTASSARSDDAAVSNRLWSARPGHPCPRRRRYAGRWRSDAGRGGGGRRGSCRGDRRRFRRRWRGDVVSRETLGFLSFFPSLCPSVVSYPGPLLPGIGIAVKEHRVGGGHSRPERSLKFHIGVVVRSRQDDVKGQAQYTRDARPAAQSTVPFHPVPRTKTQESTNSQGARGENGRHANLAPHRHAQVPDQTDRHAQHGHIGDGVEARGCEVEGVDVGDSGLGARSFRFWGGGSILGGSFDVSFGFFEAGKWR